MKQLQLGMVEDEIIKRFNILFIEVCSTEGKVLSKANAFKIMLEKLEGIYKLNDSEEEYAR